MQKNYKIDYLTLTLDSKELVQEMLPKIGDLNSFSARYQHAYRTAGGGIVMLNETGCPQGCYVSLGGQAIQHFRETGTIKEMLWLAQRARNVTRIDLAVDLIADDDLLPPPFPTPDCIYRWHERGECVTRSKSHQYIKSGLRGSEVVGATCIVGSKHGERLLRVYDKAAELQVPGIFWTRFEMQHRARQAEAKLQDCLSSGVGMATYNSIKTFCDFDDKLGDMLVPDKNRDGSEIEEFAIPGRKETRLDAYLEQVLKTLVKKAKASKEDFEKIGIFWDRLGTKMGNINYG